LSTQCKIEFHNNVTDTQNVLAFSS